MKNQMDKYLINIYLQAGCLDLCGLRRSSKYLTVGEKNLVAKACLLNFARTGRVSMTLD